MKFEIELRAVVSAPEDDCHELWGQVEALRLTLASYGACSVAMSTEDPTDRYPAARRERR